MGRGRPDVSKMLTRCRKLALPGYDEIGHSVGWDFRIVGKKNPASKWRIRMKRQLLGLVAGAAFVAASGAALAHPSFAMFDQEHPMELQGTVTEFKFTSPHTFILLEVKGTDGGSTTWNLQGASPSP